MKKTKIFMLLSIFILAFLVSGCDIKEVIAELDKDPQKVINRIEQNSERLPSESYKKDWTIMIYGSCDIEPQLEKALLQELVEMVNIGNANDKIHLVAQIDFRNAKYIKSKRYFIKKNELHVRGEFSNFNMGDPKTFEDFLKWGMSYKSEKTMLYVLGHGTGWISLAGPGAITDGLRNIAATRDPAFSDVNTSKLLKTKDLYPTEMYPSTRSFAYDHTQDDSLTLKEASSVFDRVLRGKRIDVLAFRSCLMNQLETAYEFSKHFDYFVTTQTSQLGVAQGIMTSILGVNNIGLDATVLRAVKDSDTPISSREMAKNMFTSVKNTNVKIIESVGEGFAFSAQCLDLRMLRRAVEPMKEFTYIINRNLANPRTGSSFRNMLFSARAQSVKFGGLFAGMYNEQNEEEDYEYMDLGMFMRNISLYNDNNINGATMETLKELSQNVRATLDRACVDKYTSGYDFGGITSGGVTSIFMFPESEKLEKVYSQLISSKYAELDFSIETGWDKVLNRLYSSQRKDGYINY
ncbi:MAG: clostripain-related cysteine peptidase [Candidatus Muirbacterium halophilum]|nr:clostripain-related cysteine peptidase [Candidatus Muirbacterium halophilum]MCK9474822.1 clostripain-related cysteine peptidase [Candidatus Muirbacterium halophilum]